ncbi:MAG: transposase, partial [Planctomycetes bacterium]|nr:transposase [Planctomycetota bacterium]
MMQRAVRRGLDRRKLEAIARLGVDETSFQKRHEYVTVVSDLLRNRVLYVADERTHESLDGFWALLTPEQLRKIEAVAIPPPPGFSGHLTATRLHDRRRQRCQGRSRTVLELRREPGGRAT